MIPAGHLVSAVGNEGGSVGAPGLVGNHILTDREVGGEGQQLIPEGNGVVQSDNQGLVIGGFHSQVVGVALNNFQHIAVVSAQLLGGSTLPGKLEVLGGDRLAVGPFQAVPQGVGVGHGAVFVLHALGKLGGAVSNDDQLAALVLIPLGQAREQVAVQGCAIHGGVQSGIQHVRLGSDADADGIGIAVHVSLVEILVAQGVAEETVDGVIQHEQVGVEEQGHQAAGFHQHILGQVHHGVAVGGIGAFSDFANQHIVGLGPSAVVHLDVQAVGGQVQAVDGQVLLGALTELRIVVAGGGDGQIQEGAGIVVVSHPAAPGHGEVAVLTGVQEGVPLLVLQVHGDAHGSQSGGQVLTDGLVVVSGVVQVGQSGEVDKHTSSGIIIIVLLQGLDGLVIIGHICLLGDIVVAGEAVVVAGVLVELGAVSVGHTHSNEGGSGNLTALGDLLHDVVPVKQQTDGSADFRLSQSLFFCSHVACIHRCGNDGRYGSSRCLGLGAAGSHAQNHNSSQKQCNEFLHFSFSFLNDEIYLQTPIGI